MQDPAPAERVVGHEQDAGADVDVLVLRVRQVEPPDPHGRPRLEMSNTDTPVSEETYRWRPTTRAEITPRSGMLATSRTPGEVSGAASAGAAGSTTRTAISASARLTARSLRRVAGGR